MSTLLRPTMARRVGGPVVAAFAAVYIIWGSTYLFIRIAGYSLPPLLMGGIRFLVAGGFLFAAASRFGDRAADPLGPRQWRTTAIVGVLLLGIGNGGVAYSEVYVSTGVVALLVATVPLFAAVLGAVFLHLRLGRLGIAGIVVGLLGTAMLLRPGAGAGGDFGHMLLTLASPLAWAAGSVYSTRAPIPRRPLVATAMEMLWGGLFLVTCSAAVGEFRGFNLSAVSVGSWLALLYLVVFGSLVAFSCYVWLLGKVPTNALTTYAYVNPLVAVSLGAVVLGERITLQTLLAAGLIVVAVVLILSHPSPMRGVGRADPRSESG